MQAECESFLGFVFGGDQTICFILFAKFPTRSFPMKRADCTSPTVENGEGADSSLAYAAPFRSPLE
jgi:hypothetical protein